VWGSKGSGSSGTVVSNYGGDRHVFSMWRLVGDWIRDRSSVRDLAYAIEGMTLPIPRKRSRADMSEIFIVAQVFGSCTFSGFGCWDQR
jgi:hypothetical protein